MDPAHVIQPAFAEILSSRCWLSEAYVSERISQWWEIMWCSCCWNRFIVKQRLSPLLVIQSKAMCRIEKPFFFGFNSIQNLILR